MYALEFGSLVNVAMVMIRAWARQFVSDSICTIPFFKWAITELVLPMVLIQSHRKPKPTGILTECTTVSVSRALNLSFDFVTSDTLQIASTD